MSPRLHTFMQFLKYGEISVTRPFALVPSVQVCSELDNMGQQIATVFVTFAQKVLQKVMPLR